VKLPHLSLNELFRLPGPAMAPALAGAASNGKTRGQAPAACGDGGTMLFASGSGDGGGGDYDDPPYDEPPPQSTRRSPGAQRGGAGGSGSGGRQRSIQFQPEERYWTEYLRIALPIIGLLLMIGLFWYWASQLAGDDGNGGEPIATESPGTVEMITPPSTPAPTQQVVVPPTTAPEQPPASTPDEQGPPPEEAPTEEPAPDDGTDPGAGGFAINDPVVVIDDGVNLRSAPEIAEDNIVTTLNTGDVLSIVGGPTEGEDYTWWEVIVEETNESGWVAEDFFEAAATE